MKKSRLVSILVAAVLCVTLAPGGAYAHHHHDDDVHVFVDDVYIALFFLAIATVTSPVWLPVQLTEEGSTLHMPTAFHKYPYKDGADGFISIGEGDRRLIAFADIAASFGGDELGRSAEAVLLTGDRIGLHYNQAYYYDEDLAEPRRGASSLHAMYMFARNEYWAFHIGLGGRYEHRPMKDTTLSAVYHVDCFPVKPLRLSGTYEYDGDSHFRIAASVMMRSVGVGVALRSEVIDDERYQAPEIFAAIQF